MPDERRKRTFAVMPGGAEGDGRRIGTLAVLASNVAVPSHQLGLPAVPGRAATVISLGMDYLDFKSFRAVLVAYGIRRIVDIRMLASFCGRGFDVALVFDLLAREGIAYERVPDLGNRFVGESFNQNVLFSKLLSYLQGCQEPLRALRQQIERGPVLLLGRAVEHRGSERDAVIQALCAMEGGFDVIAIQRHDIGKASGEIGRREPAAAIAYGAPERARPGHGATKRKAKRTKRTKQFKLGFST